MTPHFAPWTPAQLHTGDYDTDLRLFGIIPLPDQQGEPGFIRDVLGNRTRCSFSPSFGAYDGQVFGHPGPADHFASPLEWIGVLKSVLTAPGPAWRALEVGAHWAPWLVATAALARQRGLAGLRLHGIESDATHASHMRQHFLDNGLDPDAHALLHAPVSPAAVRGGTDGPEAVPFGDLLAHEPVWDLVHMDVQGLEAELCQTAAPLLDARVRWLVIGTHSRRIEGDLVDLLYRHGWMLDHEKPCWFRLDRRLPTLADMVLSDGTQIWWNPRLVATSPDLLDIAADDPRLRLGSGAERAQGRIRVNAARGATVLFGPYVALDAGQWLARLVLSPGAWTGQARLDIAVAGGSRISAAESLDFARLDRWSGGPALRFTLDRAAEAAELRLHAQPGLHAEILGVEFHRVGSRPD
ncbi:MAG TPA: hypothetical protein VD970_19660 [Acetobacteraceae bacterium]|nr:hypothetical protein [Acetobacteraceae bacterium]